jgi:hypothetical protein
MSKVPVPEDTFTNTVADAAAYEGYRSRNSGEDHDDDRYDRYDAMADEDDDSDEGPCCKDFSCPCGG